MRSLVLVVLLGGCSFVTARFGNDPRVGCSRTAGRADAGIAIVGVVGIAALAGLLAVSPPGEYDHMGRREFTRLGMSTFMLLSMVEGFQALHGLRVASQCEADRAKLAIKAGT